MMYRNNRSFQATYHDELDRKPCDGHMGSQHEHKLVVKFCSLFSDEELHVYVITYAGSYPSAGVRLYQPLQASCLSEWGMLDWIRFMAIKHAMDSLLVRILMNLELCFDIFYICL